MYKYNGKVIRAGRSWETNEGVKHPANWMTWSDEEKAAAGLVWEDDPLPYDSRYYWSHGMPRDVDEVRSRIISTVKQQANAKLSQSDWQIIRAMEIPAKPPSQELTAYRIAVRNASGAIESLLNNCHTIEELIGAEATIGTMWPEEI